MKKNKDYYCLNDEKALESIINLCKNTDETVINIIMEPYKSKFIIDELIVAMNEKKILTVNSNDNLNDYKNLDKIELREFLECKKEYDLIIIDDLSSYSDYRKSDFIELLDYFYDKSNKIIIFSIEEIFRNCKSIYITTQCKESNFIEPRTIVSKLNLKKKIPDIIIEYFEYFYNTEDNVIIYVEKNQKELFYDNLNKYISIFEDIKLYKDVNNYEIINLISKAGNKMIITDEIDKIIDKMGNTNLILYSANKEFFTYKKIIFICGRMSLSSEVKEMIIVSKEDSPAIELSKKIARNYNKIVWE